MKGGGTTSIRNTFKLGTRLPPWVLELGMQKAAWFQKSFYAKVDPVANTIRNKNFNLAPGSFCTPHSQCQSSRWQAGVRLKFL